MQKQYRIGIDLGGTNIQVGLVNSSEVLLLKKTLKTNAHRPWQQVVADMAALTTQVLQQLAIPLTQCEKLGIGSPGMIDHEKGEVAYSPNFKGWQNVPVVAEMQRLTGLPVKISNDANCAALGEVRAGAAKGCKNVVMLTLGTGVGGGVVQGGTVQEGGGPGAMELGHTTIVVGGAPCSCGQNGCLEAYASATGLIRMALKAAGQYPASVLNTLCSENGGKMNGIIPFKAASSGDAAAQNVVDNYICHLGAGIVNFVNIWRPEKVLLGGGISNEGAPLLLPLNKYVETRCFAGKRGFVPPIIVATLGNDAGIFGAAAI